MFSYYLKLGWLSIRRNPLLSALMVAAIAVGIGACMSIITVNYVMSGNPIPHKSDQLFYVQLDSWDPNSPEDDGSFEAPDQLTYMDAMALMKARKAYRQVASNKSGMVLEPAGDDERPFSIVTRNTWADFFPMFDLGFQYGAGWDDAADQNLERVVVLSKETNERVFGGEDSVGRNVRMSGTEFRVVGVLEEFNPVPKFYDVTNGAFDETEEAYIPFNVAVDLYLPRNGNTNCWKPFGDGQEAFLNSECAWIQFWAELRDDEEQQAYMDFLDAYAMQQKELGRFPRPLNNQLSDVMEWMEHEEVVEDDAQVMLGLSFLFLVVCLLNTIGLLLAKFLGKSQDISLRRALGASRIALFKQHMIESGLIGLCGGVFGLGLAWLGLRGIEMLFGDMVENLVGMDWVMVLTAIALAIVSALLAGLYPTWRACSVAPAEQLKLQ